VLAALNSRDRRRKELFKKGVTNEKNYISAFISIYVVTGSIKQPISGR